MYICYISYLGPESGSRSWVHLTDFGNGYLFTWLETYRGQGGEQEGEFACGVGGEIQVKKLLSVVISGEFEMKKCHVLGVYTLVQIDTLR